jgi:hypothetical protein
MNYADAPGDPIVANEYISLYSFERTLLVDRESQRA